MNRAEQNTATSQSRTFPLFSRTSILMDDTNSTLFHYTRNTLSLPFFLRTIFTISSFLLYWRLFGTNNGHPFYLFITYLLLFGRYLLLFGFEQRRHKRVGVNRTFLYTTQIHFKILLNTTYSFLII